MHNNSVKQLIHCTIIFWKLKNIDLKMSMQLKFYFINTVVVHIHAGVIVEERVLVSLTRQSDVTIPLKARRMLFSL